MIIRDLYTKSLVVSTGLLAYDKVFIYFRIKIFENMTNVVRNSEFSNDSLNFQTSAYESGLNVVFNYNGEEVIFRRANGLVYINATQMAKAFGKQPVFWLNNQYANDFLEEMSKLRNLSLADLVIVRRGGNNPGTWMYEDVALEFARWLSPSFAIWCNDRIKELFSNGFTSLNVRPRSVMSQEELEVKKREIDLEGAKILERLAQRTTIPEYHQIIDHYIMEKVTGNPDALPLPVCTERTYTATQIGNMLGVSANRIGKVANAWNLKTPENGKWFYDKSRSSNKEVETFRYNERGLNLLREIINKEGYAHKQKRRNEEDIPNCNTLFGD